MRRRPRRADPPPVARPERLDAGDTSTAEPGEPDARAVRHRPGRAGCSTAAATEVGGGEATVDATGWTRRRGLRGHWAPSMRMVVSLADLDDSRWINLTGVSGHAFTRTTRPDRPLGRGETLPWPFTRARGRRQADDRADPSDPRRSPGPEPERCPEGVAAAVTRRSWAPRAPVDDLPVVEQRAREGAHRHPGQRPVVAAAAPAQPHPGPVDRQAGARARRRRSPPRRPRDGGRRLEQPDRAGPGRRRRRRRPVEVASGSSTGRITRRPARRTRPGAGRCPARRRPRRTPRPWPRGVPRGGEQHGRRARGRPRGASASARGCARAAAGRAGRSSGPVVPGVHARR